MLIVNDIHKSYGALPVLRGASCRVEGGCFAALVGASGSGKSTLLAIAGALLNADSGRIQVADEDLLGLPADRRGQRRAALIGFVFQRFHLLPYLDVAGNIAVGGVALATPPPRARINALAQRFGLEARLHHRPHQLSVGEQQRCALARALVTEPRLILADEPTGNLDPANAGLVIDALSAFAASGGAVLMVTHDPSLAARADRRLTMHDGQIQEV